MHLIDFNIDDFIASDKYKNCVSRVHLHLNFIFRLFLQMDVVQFVLAYTEQFSVNKKEGQEGRKAVSARGEMVLDLN